MTKKPKIILFDIETSLMKVASFGLKNDFIQHTNILQDWSIICACWKELGVKKIESVSVIDDPKRFKKDSTDDYFVVNSLREMLLQADILIGHNLNSFDVKKLNARIIYNGMKPVPPVKTIDTLREARKIAKFTSNRLDYLGKFLGVGGKLSTEGGLWLRTLNNDSSAIKSMVVYCKRDVQVLEDVYLKLRPFMINHPNIADVYTLHCPKCNCSDITKHKPRVSASGIVKQQYQCKGCFGYFTERTSQKEKPLSK